VHYRDNSYSPCPWSKLQPQLSSEATGLALCHEATLRHSPAPWLTPGSAERFACQVMHLPLDLAADEVSGG